MKHRAIFAACLAVITSCASGTLVACHLTAQQAATAKAIMGPICDASGPALAPVPYVGPLGGIVAIICQEVEQEIIAAETVTPADGGPDGGVGSTLPTVLTLAAPAGCIAVPIPGDPRHQIACPELHATILAAGSRVDHRKAVRR